MNIVITGGSGFLGAKLARTLLAADELPLDGQAPERVTRITILDLFAPPADLIADPRVRAAVIDLAPPGEYSPTQAAASLAAGPLADADVIFHLASAVSGECEGDFDLGMRSNLDGGRLLLEGARALGTSPVLIFASSLAVFGQSPAQPLPDVVTDTTMPTPMTSYGIQKLVLEHLVADYTRRGYIQGRSVRLMTVSVRPGRPNSAASGFLSGIIREPLAGIRATCPVAPETAVALSSPNRTIEGIMRAAAVSATEWGPRVAANLPSIATTVGEMVQALREVAGPTVADLIDWVPDPAIEAILHSWPSRFVPDRAYRLGLRPDEDFRAIIRDYLTETV
jgi:nucleoside-diphosphate-sugar epimerase